MNCAPISCVLGGVDVGKTSLLDRLRHSNIQKNETGGITQQIGSTYLNQEALRVLTQGLSIDLEIPGLLIIDTPGHDWFNQMRIVGASVSHLVILVIDIIKGLEKQTLQCLDFLILNQIPYVIALNKLDRIMGWKVTQHQHLKACFAEQKQATLKLVDEYIDKIICQMAKKGVNAIAYYKNKNKKEYVSMVPLSSKTGEGISDLVMLMSKLTTDIFKDVVTQNPLYKHDFGHVIEIKKDDTHGLLYQTLLAHGSFNKDDSVWIQTTDDTLIEAKIKDILVPSDQKEMKNKVSLQSWPSVTATKGLALKLSCDQSDLISSGGLIIKSHKDQDPKALEKLIAVRNQDQKYQLDDQGVIINAPTKGMAVALVQILRESKIPVRDINIGKINKKTVIKTNTPLTQIKKGTDDYLYNQKFSVILNYCNSDQSVIDDDAQTLANQSDVKILSDKIIHKLVEKYQADATSIQQRIKDKYPKISHRLFTIQDSKDECMAQLLPKYVFLRSTPLLFGVKIISGQLNIGTPVAVQSQDGKILSLGTIIGIQLSDKPIDKATKNQEVCIKIDNPDGCQYVQDVSKIVVAVPKKSKKIKDQPKEQSVFDHNWKLINYYTPEEHSIIAWSRQLIVP